MKFVIALIGIGLSMVAVPGISAANPDKHAEHHAAHHPAEDSGPGATLAAYRKALMDLDLEAAGATFAEDSRVFENGKVEGSWADYAEHHLGPELGLFKSFAFSNLKVKVKRLGHLAIAEESYSYRIELEDGRIVERDGVATSVLAHKDDGWEIISYHSSSRAPRK